jgi:trehalose 6-phosphate synthase
MAQDRRLVIVSNRLPVALERPKEQEEWQLKPSSGGLVSALAPMLSRRGGLWIGWPGRTVPADGGWERPLAEHARDQGYDLLPVPLTEEELDGFYRGFSNGILWPLFHDMVSRCDFDPSFWYAYLSANQKFARAAAEHTTAEDFIWVHDYQLIHTGQMIRELDEGGPGGEGGGAGEGRRIGFFLHIPFPPLDVFLRLPWRGKILGALLAYDLLGFQTARDRRNFLNCVDRLLPGCTLAGEGSVVEVTLDGRTLKVGAFPIGIDFKSFDKTARSEAVEARRKELRHDVGPHDIVLGVDRLDYTKGLTERLRAFGNALERFPELREKVVLVQIVVPSREQVPEYQTLKAALDRLVGEINGRFSTSGWVPIRYHYRSVSRLDLVTLYRMARVGFVTSLKDGMNLVAKELCACQVDLDGALVLSEFAGAAAQLQEGALLVNPHDVEGTAGALYEALRMGGEERARRMEAMRRVVEEEDIFRWLESYLRAALGLEPRELPSSPEYLPDLDLETAWV